MQKYLPSHSTSRHDRWFEATIAPFGPRTARDWLHNALLNVHQSTSRSTVNNDRTESLRSISDGRDKPKSDDCHHRRRRRRRFLQVAAGGRSRKLAPCEVGDAIRSDVLGPEARPALTAPIIRSSVLSLPYWLLYCLEMREANVPANFETKLTWGIMDKGRGSRSRVAHNGSLDYPYYENAELGVLVFIGD